MQGHEVPLPILLHWYECGRKVQFADRAEGERLRPWKDYFYECPHADDGHWHTGRRPEQVWRNTAKQRYQLKRNAQRAWNRLAYYNAEWAWPEE